MGYKFGKYFLLIPKIERGGVGLNRKKKVLFVLAGVFILTLSSCSQDNIDAPGNISEYEHQVATATAAPTTTLTPTEVPDDVTQIPEVDNTKAPVETEVGGYIFTAVNDMVYVSVSKLNIRTEPSKDASVVFTAKSGDQFTRTGTGNGEWDQLVYQGETVYGYAPYLTKVEGSDKAFHSPEENNVSGIALDFTELTVVDITKQKYTYDDMRTDLKELSEYYKESMQLNTLAITKDGRYVYEAVIGNPDARNHVIIQASVHAREYMTSLLVMKQMEYYLHYEALGMYGGATYRELFDNVAFHILPMVNPDGVDLVQLGLDGLRGTPAKKNIKEWYDRDYAAGITTLSLSDYLTNYKANVNGVDINRNFDYGWIEFTGAKNQGSEKYKGNSAASEPETVALVDLTENINPVATISYHATGSVLYWDYGQSGVLRESCMELANIIHNITGYEIKYAATDKQDAAGYGDWCVMVKGIPSITIEIGTGTAPLSVDEFSFIWNKNWEVWAALALQYRL